MNAEAEAGGPRTPFRCAGCGARFTEEEAREHWRDQDVPATPEPEHWGHLGHEGSWDNPQPYECGPVLRVEDGPRPDPAADPLGAIAADLRGIGTRLADVGLDADRAELTPAERAAFKRPLAAAIDAAAAAGRHIARARELRPDPAGPDPADVGRG